jgi:hypothetical protein
VANFFNINYYIFTGTHHQGSHTIPHSTKTVLRSTKIHFLGSPSSGIVWSTAASFVYICIAGGGKAPSLAELGKKPYNFI